MKNRIAIEVSRLEGFDQPKASLEQYVTPPNLVADLVHSAYMQGDVEGQKVVDLGSGTGFFAVATAELGADVTAVEKDEEAIETLEKNAEEAGVDLDIRKTDVRGISGDYDTVFMNPPFSVHTELGEEFLRKAMEVSDSIYAVLGPKLFERLKEFSDSWAIEAAEDYTLSLPPTMGFHTEEEHEIGVKAVHARKIQNGA